MTMTSKPLKSLSQDGLLSKSEQTRAMILAAAARYFRCQGYNAATMRKIAKFANIEAGSIYYHFLSKEDILDEVLELGLSRLYNEARQILAKAKAQDKGFQRVLSEMVDTHLTFLLSQSDFTSANIRNFPMLSEELRQKHRPLRRAYSDLWNGFLTEAQQNGCVRTDIAIKPVRQFVLGALNWTVEWYDAERYPVATLSERVTKLLLEGMATKGHSPVLTPKLDRKQFSDPEADYIEAGQTRQQVLSAAAGIIRDRGYKAASVAGIEAGSIYYHFRSKDDILDEVLDKGLRILLQEVTWTVSNRKQEDNLRIVADAIEAHMECLFQASEFTSANIRTYGQLPSDVRARNWPVRHEYALLWDRILDDAQKSGGLRPDIKIVPLRQVMLGALNWTVEWFDPAKAGQEGNISLSGLVEILQKLLLSGLSK
jgi:AcrR family transcriptional regulator